MNLNIVWRFAPYSSQNNAETDFVRHLGPRTFRSTWVVPKYPTVKCPPSSLFFLLFIYFFFFFIFFHYLEVF